MADIELVIKLPEEIYKATQIIKPKHDDVIQIPLEVIANGIPLEDNCNACIFNPTEIEDD